MPLQGSRKDRKWSKIDLIGSTLNRLPGVVELKQGRASDTPLRMLVEAVAHASALRRASNEGRFRAERQTALNTHGLDSDMPQTLDHMPMVLLAPTQFWNTKMGMIGTRSSGMVRADGQTSVP